MLVLFFGVTFAKAQNIYVCKNAQLSFFSSAPIEDIEAVTSQGISAMNIKTGDIFVKVGIQSFQFKKSLMQEHFNEDYL
ncbi:MAG TPA: YceI family protein, partial [Chitinophagaceae bacterium]